MSTTNQTPPSPTVDVASSPGRWPAPSRRGPDDPPNPGAAAHLPNGSMMSASSPRRWSPSQKRCRPAGREPHQVAPGPHHLVLRDLRARPHLAGLRAVDPAYGYLFNSYYEAVGAARPPRAALTRPGIAEIGRYRGAVDDGHGPAAGRRRPDLPIGGRAGRAGPQPRAAAPGADPHRHQARVRRNPLRPAYRAAARPTPGAPAGAGAVRWLDHGGGSSGSGTRATASPSTTRRPATRSCSAVRHPPSPVTDGEYLAFIADGGYRERACGCPTGGPPSRPGVAGAAVLGSQDGRRLAVQTPRPRCRGSSPTSRSCHVS